MNGNSPWVPTRRHGAWEPIPDADLTVDLRNGTPDFYIIDKNHNVRFKHLTIDQVLDVARQLKKR